MSFITLATTVALFAGFTAAAPISARATVSASFSTLPQPVLAPYYLYFGNTAVLSLPDAFDQLGMKAATVAFASAPKGQCQLTTDLDNLVQPANDFISKGGALALSFGGNLNNQAVPRQHVQQACTDVTSLSNLIQGAMTTFSTHNIEFDIEDNDLLADTAAGTRLAQALAAVKKAVPDTHITYTLSTGSTGVGAQQVAQLQAAQDAGVPVDAMTVMTMDMNVKDNVAAAQTAVKGGAAQLAKVQKISTADAMKKMGMLPAIGADDQGVVIDTAGATTLGQFAKAQGLAIMSYWSFNRDFPGSVGASAQSLDESGSPDQTTASQFLTTFQKALS